MESPTGSPIQTAFDQFLVGVIELLNRVQAHPNFQEKVISRIHQAFDPIIKDMTEQRLPRIALVGRRGAGKSSLLNALFEQYVADVSAVRVGTIIPTWNTLKGRDGEDLVDILDTRGVQEGEPPTEVQSITSLESVLTAIREKTPDLFLFLVRAKEVNSAVQEDLKAMGECLNACKVTDRGRDFYPVVIGIVTQCDELDPPSFWSPEDRKFYSQFWEGEEIPHPSAQDRNTHTGFSNANVVTTATHPDYKFHVEKLENIRQAVEDWRKYLKSVPGIDRADGFKVIPTSAHARFNADKTIITDSRLDLRWNVQELKDLMLPGLPAQAQMEFYRHARIVVKQHSYAQMITAAAGMVCAVIGLEPIPIFDIGFLNLVMTLECLLIAYIAGLPLSWSTAVDFLAEIGITKNKGMLLREGFRALVKLVPVGGPSVSAAIARKTSVDAGRLAIKYFIDNENLDTVGTEWLTSRGIGTQPS